MTYAQGRGWGQDTIQELGLGQADGRLTHYLQQEGVDFTLAEQVGLIYRDEQGRWRDAIPAGYLVYVHQRAGAVEYLSGRATFTNDKKKKARNLHASKQPYWLIRRHDGPLLVVEGQADAITAWQWGYNTVALGGTALEDDQIAAMQWFRAVYLALDNDASGAEKTGLVADSLGRRLGYDQATGDDLAEIPNGVYLREEDTGHKSIFLPSPEAGESTLTLTGVGTGEYTLLGYFNDDQATVNLFAITGTTTLSQIETFTVTVPITSTEVPSPPDVQAGPDIYANKGQPVTFVGQFSDINSDETHTIDWDFGDGGLATDTLTPTHTYVDTGSFTVTLTVTDSYGFAVDDALIVDVAPVFQEDSGQVVMEAEHFARQFIPGKRAWFSQTILSGYTGSAYLSALPDTDLLFTLLYTTTSPELQYGINFTTIGTYAVWLRGYAPNGAGDSVYLGLDGQTALTPTIVTGFDPRTWSWTKADVEGSPATIEVTEPGVHTLQLWLREDGLRLDRILLTTARHLHIVNL